MTSSEGLATPRRQGLPVPTQATEILFTFAIRTPFKDAGNIIIILYRTTVTALSQYRKVPSTLSESPAHTYPVIQSCNKI